MLSTERQELEMACFASTLITVSFYELRSDNRLESTVGMG